MAYETQLAIVLNHLKIYGAITSWQCIQEYRITRLSEYIRHLRRELGWIIDDKWETDGIKKWKRYYLIPSKQNNKI